MKKDSALSPDMIPTFSWDRNLTCRQIQELLSKGSEFQKNSTLSWVLREATMDEIWFFCTPEQAYNKLPVIENHLGRRKELLRYILRTWHELGKF
jgi:hypothetical protein